MSTFTYSGNLYSKIEVRIKYNILIYYVLCRYAGVRVLEYSFNWTYIFFDLARALCHHPNATI